MSSTVGPGAHIFLRDAEWRVVRVESTSSGKRAFRCVGVSEIIRDQEELFLEEFDTDWEVVDPRQTRLEQDESPGHRAARLYVECLLRQVAPPDDALCVGHRAAMDFMEYQLVPAWKALGQPRQRILIADAVGLGKTIEAGVLLAELIRRGRGRRILVATVRSMLTQFQKEMWARFAIPLVRLDSVGLQRIRAQIPTHHNPFYYFDKVIVSIDTIKQNNWFRAHLEQAKWDVVVIDEAHNVASRGSGRSLRSRLADVLARNCDSLILLSATPHDGKPRSFASLMSMLDPTAIADPDHYTKDDIRGLFVRRFKKDVEQELGRHVPERHVEELWADATEAEERVHEYLADLEFQRLDRSSGRGVLFKTTLIKALFSSPASCLDTARHRKHRIERRDDAQEFARDIAALGELESLLLPLVSDPGLVAKFNRLVALLTEDWKWNPRRATEDRVVIFTERRETQSWLVKHLPDRLGLRDGQYAVLHGGMSDVDQQEVVGEFAKRKSSVRLLLATDVAAEGLNLHYYCHRLVHFDVPWSLMLFQQRNGRIDRYGQEHEPHIVYVLTKTRVEAIRGDQRILELLIEKDEQAHRNIGDPSVFMNVYDPEEEERITARAMERGLSPEEFESELNAHLSDPFALLLAEASEEAGDDAPERVPIREPDSLFESDADFLVEALEQLRSSGSVEDLEARREEGVVTFPAPRDLLRRYERLPREIRPRDGRLTLTWRRELMERALVEARRTEEDWPALQYFWPIGPVTDWLSDRLQEGVPRQKAPIIILGAGLEEGEAVVVVSGVWPNRLGEPLVHEWYAVHFLPDPGGGLGGFRPGRTEPFSSFLRATGMRGHRPPNPTGLPLEVEGLQRLVPTAVERAAQALDADRTKRERAVRARLTERLETLAHLEARQLERVAELYGGRTDSLAEAARNRERKRVERLFESHRRWTEDRSSLADRPYLQVVAAFVRPEGWGVGQGRDSGARGGRP